MEIQGKNIINLRSIVINYSICMFEKYMHVEFIN